MSNLQSPPPIHVSQSTEIDESPSIQTARDKSAAAAEDSYEWTNEQIINAVRERLRQLDWSLVSTILAVKLIIFIFGAQSYLLMMNRPFGSWYGLIEVWNRWDSLRHIRLEKIGYAGVGSDRADLIGFPLFPWLARLFAIVFQDYLISSFVVSGLALIAAGLLLHKLVSADFPDSTARNAVWFMLIFPTAYFLHINYNESLFIALTIGSFLAARRGQWQIAGILGIFVCMTRLNGLIIVPALMVEAFLQYRTTSRRFAWQWLWILAAPLGFAVYLLVNQYVAGDAFAFLAVGRDNFQKSLSPPWVGIRGVYDLMQSSEISLAQMSGVQEMTFVVLGAVGTIACGFLLRASYTVWMAGNWFLFVSSGFILSVPRYTLVMFPIYILFAKFAESRVWNSAITVWSLLLLALFVSKFVQGHWAF